MGRLSKLMKKRIAQLKRGNEVQRQKSLVRKAARLTLTTGEIKYFKKEDDPTVNVSNYSGGPVEIIVKREIDNLEDDEDDQREDPDWIPTTSPPSSAPPPCQLLGMEKTATSGSATSHLKALTVTSGVTNCLLCDRLRKSLDWTPSHSRSLTEANFRVYFILRKMLNVPKSKLVDYLVKFGDPRQWIKICRECLSIVDKAVRLQRDISRLEEKLRECQDEMKERIRKSIKVTKPSNTLTVGNINQVTMETRKLVCGESQPSGGKININLAANKISTSSCDQKSFAVAILSTADGEGTSEHPAVKLVSCQFEEYPDEEEDKLPETSGIQLISHGTSSDDDGTESETESGSGSDGSNSLYEAPITMPCDDNDDEDNHEDNNSDGGLKGYQVVITSEVPLANQSASSWKLLRKDYECFQEGAYSCQICDNDKQSAGVGVMSLEKFIGHMIFHKKRPLKCAECGLHFANLDEVKKKNRLCADRSPSSIRNRNHVCTPNTVILQMDEKFDPGKIWKCEGDCLSIFNFEDDRDNHQDTCEQYMNKASDNTLESRRKFACQICEEDEEFPNKKAYTSLTEWALHRCLSHPDKAVQSCLYCNQIFSIKTKEDLPNYYALRIHMQKNHSPAPLRRSPDVCDFCGGVFFNVLEFTDHLKSSHNLAKGTAYSCEICYLRSSQRCLIRRHINLMHNVLGKGLPPVGDEAGSLICDICGHKVLRKNLLTFLDHKLTQHGIIPGEDEDDGDDKDKYKGYRERIRRCDKEGCGFKSLFQRKVRVHGMKMHGGERELRCQYCGKGFLYRGKLREHEEIHKNKSVKPYQCEICGNRFAVKNYLYIHMRLSHQNRPFASTNKKRTRKSAV